MARAVVALAIVYAFGYVSGSILVDPEDDRASLAAGSVRLISGLLLTTVAFLLCLAVGLPWFSGPFGVLAMAVVLNGRRSLAPPALSVSFQWSGTLAGLIAFAFLAPPVISALRMAPGDFPPVFFNVDVPYFLEKVHSLIGADAFPPESLSVAGGRRPYHFGIHGLAAVISQGSGIAPHHAVFLIVVPLLTIGIVSAALTLARTLAPAVPLLVSLPLLVVSVPTLWYDYSINVWRDLQQAVTSQSTDPLRHLAVDWQMWGLTSNIQNLAAHFLVLASLGAIARAPVAGWRLATFLIGSAFVFKSPAGVALVAGFGLAQTWQAFTARSLRPLTPVITAGAVFGIVYGAFWILPGLPADLRAEFSPFFYLEYLSGHAGLGWFAADVTWLILPALLVLPFAGGSARRQSLPLLVFAAAPFFVVNLIRLVDMRRGYGISSMNEDDWRQVIMPVPLLLHAFALSVVGQRWVQLTGGVRTAVQVVVLLAAVPAVIVAVRYVEVLMFMPESAHEFADNRSIGEALAVIPTEHTLIVTNDLRYPADGFARDNRQMQIPALFGHQAFAVNYFYEAYPFSEERQDLQQLLKGAQWTPAIDQAARAHGWTHLVIRNDYAHPANIPLERLFDNGVYAVFRFPAN